MQVLKQIIITEPGHEKICLMPYANNKGADQPAHPRSLISAFVVRCLDSVMSLVSVTKISSLVLASVAEQASWSRTWSETPEDMFSHGAAHMIKVTVRIKSTCQQDLLLIPLTTSLCPLLLIHFPFCLSNLKIKIPGKSKYIWLAKMFHGLGMGGKKTCAAIIITF